MRKIWSLAAIAMIAGGVQAGLALPAYADTGVSVSSANLRVTAADGKANEITISFSAQGDVVVTDTGDVVRPGSGCLRQTPNSVVCPGVQVIQADLKDLDDTFTNTTGIGARVKGGTGEDTMTAGSGGDTFTGGPGDDVFTGGAGSDNMVADRAPDGTDVFSGGPGADTAVYNDRIVPQTVSLDGVANDGSTGENDNMRADVENVFGGALGDTLTGNGLANEIRGGRGDDTLTGRGGADVLSGGGGTDTCNSDAADTEFGCEI
ncbi:hypothetical protein GCM10010156_58940 [Planobispora rosea]|uniref:Calcium-binding protein n=1 Tax=Planobispora rosea TaxID=35762 RepID=A0A8J3SCF7_PLARO|nr:hypothetical protein [Planobispora rosea]GGS92899.1 hypothetical protein GCM10010156_58940 [Planobispora rosea]GIH87208.1 hypothetical protein Pro02_56160 [Planobispora rosea]